MKIKIYRGHEGDLHAWWAAEASKDSRRFLLGEKAHRFRSWSAIRGLFGQLVMRLPAKRIAEVLAQNRPLASLVFHELEPQLDAEQRSEREALTAPTTSHMTHNFILQTPIVQAWSELLVKLLAETGSRPMLVAPFVNLLKWEDIALLKVFHRQYRDRPLDLVLGYDPSRETLPDEDGIVWPYSAAKLSAFIDDLRVSSECEVVDLVGGRDRAEPPDWAGLLGAGIIDEDPEGRAFKILSSASAPLTAEEGRRVAKAVRAAFRSFSFATALRLGRDLMAKGADLEPDERSQVHTLVGLSAHNRQFLTATGPPALGRFIESHYLAALPFETCPIQRSALMYRLAVTQGRRMKSFEAGLSWANRAVDTASDSSLSPLGELAALYQETWARNIRAYVLLRLRRYDESQVDVEVGYKCIDKALAGSGDAATARGGDAMWLRDVQSTHSLLAYNTYNLSSMTGGSAETLESLLGNTEIGIRDIPGVEKFEAQSWTRFYLENLRLSDALTRTLSGLDSARDDRDVQLSYQHSIQAADIYERLGEAGKAQELYTQAQAQRSRLGLPASMALEMRLAMSAARAGKLDKATAVLDGTDTLEGGRTASGRAQVLAAKAVVAARGGDHDLAQERIDQAIDIAVESGDRTALLRVAIAAGQACSLIGWTQDAREAYSQALDIATVEDGMDPVAADDLMAALIGIQECGGAEAPMALRGIKLLPEALAYPDTWWHLGRFLKVLQAVAEREPTLLRSTDLTLPLEKLDSAARQRPDCAAPLQSFHAALQ